MSDRCIYEEEVGSEDRGILLFRVYERTTGIYITPIRLTRAGGCVRLTVTELSEALQRCQEAHDRYHTP